MNCPTDMQGISEPALKIENECTQEDHSQLPGARCPRCSGMAPQPFPAVGLAPAPAHTPSAGLRSVPQRAWLNPCVLCIWPMPPVLCAAHQARKKLQSCGTAGEYEVCFAAPPCLARGDRALLLPPMAGGQGATSSPCPNASPLCMDRRKVKSSGDTDAQPGVPKQQKCLKK